ncbi:MAG TPA: TIGR04053 family radical SAM/SPASM domain-containing protein [Anaerolineales bacterium]|nr:TIGR04053 family radical SAM/SPASM domain-containing protein [Anaerolineales bacterium]
MTDAANHPSLAPTAAEERAYHDRKMVHADFDRAPFTIAWEVTRACAFACVHCRADAQHRPDPRELNTDEALRLIDRLADFGSPILVFTGGDPMMRRDLFELIAYAADRGLRCSLTPTATALPTVARLEQAKTAGIRRIALSLDAPTPEVHDEFRQVKGSWQRTMQILHNAGEVGLSVQVNTTVTAFNADLLADMIPFIEEVEAVQWSVFFLVPTGRAQGGWMVSPERHEQIFHWLYDLSQTAPFDIKATAAPMYRRVAIERKRAESGAGEKVTFQGAGFQYADGLDRPTRGVNDGNGFLFISHLGQIMPSGFLPVDCGSVRDTDVVEVYRNHPVFKDLRDYSQLKGKCGVCEYRDVCGGQRGRAFGLTGDYMESDPACLYEPEIAFGEAG